jgi:hypothetical protein
MHKCAWRAPRCSSPALTSLDCCYIKACATLIARGYDAQEAHAPLSQCEISYAYRRSSMNAIAPRAKYIHVQRLYTSSVSILIVAKSAAAFASCSTCWYKLVQSCSQLGSTISPAPSEQCVNAATAFHLSDWARSRDVKRW